MYNKIIHQALSGLTGVSSIYDDIIHWRLADARNCSYGQPNMADDDSGKFNKCFY